MGACWLRSIYRRRIGHEEVNGAEQFAPDPTLRLIGSASAFQDRGKHGDEPRRKIALERLPWRHPGVYF